MQIYIYVYIYIYIYIYSITLVVYINIVTQFADRGLRALVARGGELLHACIIVYMHIYTYIYIYIYIYICIQTLYIYIYMYIHTHMFVCFISLSLSLWLSLSIWIYMYLCLYTYTYTYFMFVLLSTQRAFLPSSWPGCPVFAPEAVEDFLQRLWMVLRPIVILRISRPRIFESKFRDHCAKKLDGALRKSTSFV